MQNPRNYTIGVYRNETLIYTYLPQLGDLFITNQAGQVVNQPTTADTCRLQLSQQGLSNVRRVPDLQGYTLQSNVTTTIQLYQPYTPNTQDYQQNYGSLDGYSIRQTSATEAAIHVAGWHATNQSIGRPYHTLIILDAQTGHELLRYTTKQYASRPDLTRAFPGIITAGQSGFNVDLQLVPGMGNQPLQIVSRWSATQDANSNYVDYWFTPVTLYRDTANLDRFAIQGNVVYASGWHATSQSLGRPYHYLLLFDRTTNREVQRVKVTAANSARPDVARTFPGTYNAGQSGFNTQFTVQPALNDHELVVLSRWTDDPAGNGNAVDYWFGQTVTPNVPVDKAKQLD